MNKLQNFVIGLDGYLDAVGDEINISKTNLIKNKLNNLFEHVVEPVVEPVAPEGQTLEELGEEHGFQVHQGFPNSLGIVGTGDDGVTYRC